jgi:hypothetical protein
VGGSNTQILYNSSGSIAGLSTFTTDGTNLVLSTNSATSSLRITQIGAGNALVVEDSANPDTTPFVVDGNGRVTVGGPSPVSVDTNSETFLQVQNAAKSPNLSALGATFEGTLALARTNGTIASPTVVASGNALGTIGFFGYDGVSYQPAAYIRSFVDATPGAGDMPGRLEFLTTPNATSVPVLRLEITNSGDILFRNGSSSIIDYATGYFTLGTLTPQSNRLFVRDTDASSNTVLDVLRLDRQSSAAPAAGIGVGMEFSVETASGNTEIGASIEAVTTDVTAGSEDFDLRFYTMAAGVTAAERMRLTSTTRLGIGTTSPAVTLHATSTTATTNAVTQVLRVDSQSSGTPANGIGVGIEFATETSAGNTEIGATIEAITTDVTAGSEDFDLSFKTMAAGAAAAERMRVTSTGNFQFNSGYGSVATAYGCRAWVNFNGTGTVAIRADGGVSSITDNGTGDYTVNFDNAMPDTNYSTVFGGAVTWNQTNGDQGWANLRSNNGGTSPQQTGSVRIWCSSKISSIGAAVDNEQINVAIFR